MSLSSLFTRSALPAVGMAFLLAGCKSPQAATTSGPPPVPVSLASATQESVPLEVAVVGTIEASSVVQVKSQIAGELIRVNFREGADVQKGSLLFEIDPRPYQQALRQAESALAKDRAQLRQAEAVLARDQADLRNADAEAGRYSAMLKEALTSRSQQEQVKTRADVAQQSVQADQAGIESARAAIQSDLAALDRAKLDISYCSIYAPISGRTGNLLVSAGNLVKANGDNALVVIHQVSPIYVNFNIPEQHLRAVRQLASKQGLPIRVSAKDDPSRSATAHVRVVDNTVDAQTGTIHVKGELPNQDAFFWPGQFVNVAITLGMNENATIVPAEAVQSGQEGQFVYVVKPDKTVEPRVVHAGRAIDRRMIIDKGIAPGDVVVIDGHMRLFPGARIQPVDPAKITGTKL